MVTTECLLCGKALNERPSWSLLFQRFDQTICKRCEQSFEQVDEAIEITTGLTVRALFHYNVAMKDYFHRYKFMHDTILSDVFSKQIYDALKHTHVVPIPMHRDKLKERTFSPVELLLQSAGIYYESLLEKTTVDTQGSKTREERLQTPQFFRLVEKPTHSRYTIFDDIVTTGVTLQHAKALLLQAGVTEVSAVTLIKA